MSNQASHPAVELLRLVKCQDLASPGVIQHELWRAAWSSQGARCRVSFFSPTRQSKDQVVETIIALTSSGCPGVLADEIAGTTRFEFIIPMPVPMRIEEDEEGYPRMIAMANPNNPGLFLAKPNPFGGDAA
jgi:hypothetical protein